MSAETALAGEPLALSSERLYALGAELPLDGRLSWAPALAQRSQFVNAYLLLEGDRGLLVDTGVPTHAEVVLKQLSEVVPDSGTLTVFLTRAEMDCMANLGAVNRHFRLDAVMTGGAMNPFDAFDDVHWLGSTTPHQTIERTDRGGIGTVRINGLRLGADREVVVITPRLRLLSTFWLYDACTGALFTSDMFGHTDSGSERERTIESVAEDSATVGSVARHLFSKYWWLVGADTEPLRADLDEIFERFDPEIVAPTHGRILVGRDVVAHHRQLLDTILADPTGFAV